MVLVQAYDFSPIEALGLRVRRKVTLAPLTTMKVGGAAEYYVTVSTTDHLVRVVRWARAAGLPWFVLGGGSNILISDAGISGLVIHNRCKAVRIDEAPCCVWPQDERPYLFAESGAPMAGAARISVNAGLAGLEWAISIPGTVGGAIVGNAGAYGGEVKDTLEYGWLLDEAGEISEFRGEELAYAYRNSTLKRGKPLEAGFKPVVLSANFRLPRGEPAAIKAKADEYLRHRRRSQPVEPSLGSMFVNPPGDFAGRLIEAAGLKGLRSGGLMVSALHANFFINAGGAGTARAQDVINLMQLVQQRVADQFGILLQAEVQLAGDWSQSDRLLFGQEE